MELIYEDSGHISHSKSDTALTLTRPLDVVVTKRRVLG